MSKERGSKWLRDRKQQREPRVFWTNFVLILICVIWMVPVIGILITSFRPSEDIFKTGWWTVFPHKEDIEIDRVVLPEDVDVNGPITYGGKRPCSKNGKGALS